MFRFERSRFSKQLKTNFFALDLKNIKSHFDYNNIFLLMRTLILGGEGETYSLLSAVIFFLLLPDCPTSETHIVDCGKYQIQSQI